MEHLGIFFSYTLVTNLVLTRFLGLCPFIGLSQKIESALGIGIAVTFVSSLASLLCAALYHWILIPLELRFLRLIVFIFVIAALVQLIDLAIERLQPRLHAGLGIYLPLITSNCAVLGIVIWNLETDRYRVLTSFWAGLSAGTGFTLATVLMAGIRERLQLEKIPQILRGHPIGLISAALMAMGFSAFDLNLLRNLGF